MVNKILEDNEKLVTKFGAKRASSLLDIPDFYTFKKGLIYSHRDFDKFYERLKKGEKSAIVSGVNASGTLHLGHKVVFDTNLYFQKKFGIPVYIPISDDESYVSGKVKTQEEGKENAIKLAKEMIAYGFDPKKTYFIIDNIYTNIYNLAFKLSTKINYSEIKAAYGYKPEENIGLHFYPTVQSAHVLFPNEHAGIKNILVPIGPDEDAHLRISRDIAARAGYDKVAVVHLTFMPGLDGEKASKSKKNAIHLNDDEKTLKKACNKALSGGRETIEEHKKHGGDPEKDISCQYLSKYFYDEKQSNELFLKYMNGQLLSGEVKNLLFEELKKLTGNFQTQVKNVKDNDLDKSILRNE
jgi:tryptophanyl-tRNA synthetase